MGWSVTDTQHAIETRVNVRPGPAVVRGGVVLVCRTGCDRRLDDSSATATDGLAVFVVEMVVWVRERVSRVSRRGRERERERRLAGNWVSSRRSGGRGAGGRRPGSEGF